MDVQKNNNRKYELVAPDGGWGIMIVLGAILNLISLTAFISCFGMIYKDLFIKINMDSTGVTMFNGLASFCVAMTGFISNFLRNFMSVRQQGLLSSLVFNLGMVLTVFVNSKLQFFVAQGIIQALGNGWLFNVTCSMVNDYFVKKRLLAFSITHTIVAVAGLFSPQFVRWSLETYGYKGTILLLSAVTMQNIVGMALMQPVAWHMKKVEIRESKENELKLLLKGHHESNNENINTSVKLQKSNHQIYANNEEHITKDIKLKDSKIKIFFSRFIDVSLIKPFLLSSGCIGLAFSGFLDLTFTMLLPQALYAKGWSENEVAKALSLTALVDLITRIAFILMNNVFLKIGSHATFIVGLVIGCITRLGMLWTDNKLVMYTFISLMGISRCTVTLLMPIVVADSVCPEKYPAAFGMVLLSFGMANLLVGPIIGAIRDLTDSYTIAFYTITAGLSVIAVTWSIELIYKKRKRNNITNIDSTLISS